MVVSIGSRKKIDWIAGEGMLLGLCRGLCNTLLECELVNHEAIILVLNGHYSLLSCSN